MSRQRRELLAEVARLQAENRYLREQAHADAARERSLVHSLRSFQRVATLVHDVSSQALKATEQPRAILAEAEVRRDDDQLRLYFPPPRTRAIDGRWPESPRLVAVDVGARRSAIEALDTCADALTAIQETFRSERADRW